MHSAPDDANLNDTLLQHCDLLANQMSSIAAAAASTQDITLQLHLPTEAADLNIQSLEAICKLASLHTGFGSSRVVIFVRCLSDSSHR